MDVYEGYSVNAGSVLASAAKVRFDFGIPSLTPQRLRALGERLMRHEEGGYIEPEQVILVAEAVPAAMLAGTIPGIEVVGLAVGEYVDTDMTPDVTVAGLPIVGGLGDSFVNNIMEHDLLLLDGDTGRVFAAPDAAVVARYQSKPSRKRYFTDGAHVPAKTASDNRVVPVIAVVSTREDVELAMSNGADGIYLVEGNEILAADAIESAEDQLAALFGLIDATGGKPIMIDMPASQLAPSAVLEAGAAAPITVVASGFDSALDFASSLNTARLFAPADAKFGDPELVVRTGPEIDIDLLPEDLDDIAGIVFRSPLVEYTAEVVLCLLGMAVRCKRIVLSFTGESWSDEIEQIINFGIDRIVTAPSAVADVKDTIRQL